MSHFNNSNNMNTTTEQGLRRTQAGMGQTYGESPASGPAPTTAGHHSHDILNKLDPRVDSTLDRQPMPQNAPAGTYGPHSSRLANMLDPRVDSSNPQAQTQGMNAAGAGMAGGPGVAGRNMGAGGGVPEGTYGPHRSRVANAMDPRVDSDMDRGQPGYQTGGYGAGAGATAGAGMMGQQAQGHGYRTQETMHGGMGTTTTGTHHGRGQGGVGTMGGGAGAGAGAGNPAMSGPGPAPNTAGPHRSDLLNKLDPRVDSTTGMMKTTERRGI